MEYRKPKTKLQAELGLKLLVKFRKKLNKEDLDFIGECIQILKDEKIK